MTAVEVCPICDIAGCRHIRERATSAEQLAAARLVKSSIENGGVIDVVWIDGPIPETPCDHLHNALAPFGKATE